MNSLIQLLSQRACLGMLMIVFILIGCNSDKNKKVDVANFEFNTTDATELYFKNIRESYYNIEEKEGIKIFRLKEYDEIDSVWIKPLIVYHWRVDKAFLMLEFHPKINPEEILISDNTTEKSYQVVQIKDHLILAYDLYNMLLNEREPNIMINNQQISLFSEKLEKSNFSLVLYDFFRFTNVF